MCMIDDAEYGQLYHAEKRRARKAHRCTECGREIAPGETYDYATMLYDGCFDDFKTCAHCGVAVDWLRRECGGAVHHAVLDDMEDHARDAAYGFDVRRLYVSMRRGWHTRSGTLRQLPRMPKLTPHEPQRGSIPW